MQDVRQNRQHKDVLFKYVLKDKADLLELYNAINGSAYTDPEELEYNTLEDAVYLGIKNDVSFIIHNSMNLYEHQSTVNPNMPLRGLFYFSSLYKKFVGDSLDIYSKKLVQLPTPQYIQFHGKIREYQEQGYTMEEAVDKAVSYCVEHDILRQILVENRSAFMDDILTTYDAEKHMELIARENFEEGYEQGIERGEKKFAELTRRLVEMHRTEDIIRATVDQQFKISLYQEFKL